MTVSIIIAVKAYSKNLGQCVNKCLELDFKDYEIIVLPDFELPRESFQDNSKLRVIPTGDITPPQKRDIGARHAKGKILAFLDDDAYPAKEWLKEAVNIFKESDKYGCVCGPALTPEDDTIAEKASGLVYTSSLVSGKHKFRYIPGRRREVFDFPSCNFLIRKELFLAIGGFDKSFWPGEDTFLCLKVLEAGEMMIYSPKVLVYHHRRSLFKGHLNQIKSYALHRGYFAKRYPKTSLRPEYFIPSLFTIFLLAGGLLSPFSFPARAVYVFILTIYLVFILAGSFSLVLTSKEPRANRVELLFLTICGIFLTHITYGIYFIKGLLAGKMPEESC